MKIIVDFQLAVGEIGTLRGVAYIAFDSANDRTVENGRVHYTDGENFRDVQETESQINELIFNALKTPKC